MTVSARSLAKRSRRGIANSKHARISEIALAIAFLIFWSALWTSFFYRRGYLAYYGDAEAHLNIARRILDSRTPGYDQLGSVWLPLPHLLVLLFARNDVLWRTALAGAIASGCSFVTAGAFLFAAVRQIFASTAVASTALAVFVLNPNILYLHSTAMSEPLFMAALMALMYCLVCFADTQSWAAVVGAGTAALCGTLSRYDGWFLLPFAALFVLLAAKKQRLAKAALFATVACLGPLYWLGHNWWCCSNALDFYNGPYSAKAIQGAAYYPGKGEWGKALLYFETAVRWCAGRPLLWLGAAGLLVAFSKREPRWIALLLLLPGVFYVWSMHSSGNPIFVPDLWPHSYYNTRYGLALLPALVFGAAALVSLAPGRARPVVALIVAALTAVPWLAHPQPDAWITWKESQVNSVARRAWTTQAAAFLAPRYRAGSGVFTTFGDITGIYRQAGIPLRETLTWDNWPLWPSAIARPDLFLWEEWAVAINGDPVQSTLRRRQPNAPRYELVKIVTVPGAPAVEIYHCCVGSPNDANSLH